MVNSVEEYLDQLRKELAGCDPAIVQDALSDSEEHLRTALGYEPSSPEADPLASIIEKYGSPEEVAAGYRELEQSPSRPMPLSSRRQHSVRSVLSRFFGVLVEARAWAALLYLVLSLGTGYVYFTWVVTGLSLTVVLLVTVFGFPLLILLLLSVRGLAFVEGRMVEVLLGIRMPRRTRYSGTKAGWGERTRALFADRTTWTAILYLACQLPLGVLYFTVLVTLIATSLGCIAGPIVAAFEPDVEFVTVGCCPDKWEWATMPLIVLGGVVLLTASMHLVKLLGRMHGRYAKIMLVSQ